MKRHGTVCYTYWTFSFGRLYDELPEVDPKSFKSVEDWLGRDNNHVYYKGQLVKGADPATLKAKRFPLFRDHHDYYYAGTPIHVADVQGFQVVKWCVGDHFWGKDSQYVYYDSLRVASADPQTFKVCSESIGKDNRRVYYKGKELKGADPATFVEIGDGVYMRDKAHVWWGATLLEDADAATFHVNKEGDGIDRHGAFHYGKRVTYAP